MVFNNSNYINENTHKFCDKYIGSKYGIMGVPVIGDLFRSTLQWEQPKQLFYYFTNQ